MSSVQLKINKENLVNNLRFAFTNKDTVISELMQNARRAGSDHVSFDYDEDKKVLVVEDQGCGLDDPQTILTIAESGWDENTQNLESPFGLGFMSALFSAEHVKIESNSMSIEFHTESVLNFNKISVLPSDKKIGTRITLTGIDFHVASAVTRFSHGYPIKVFFNTVEQERDHALDGPLDYISTPIGDMRITDLKEPVQKHQKLGTRDIIVYLQGIRVYKSSCAHSKHANIVHLDATQFKGRLPDRDKLVDEDEVIDKVKVVIDQYWQTRLQNDIQKLEGKAIAEKYFATMKYWNQMVLLNAVDYLPTEVVSVYNEYPIELNEWEDGNEHYDKVIAKQDILNGQTIILNLEEDLCAEEPFQVSMYAYALNALFLSTHDLDKKHWLYDSLVDVSIEDLTLRLEGAVSDSYVGSCDYFDSEVIFCDQAVISGPCGDVTITSDAFYYAGGFMYRQGYPAAVCIERYSRGVIVIPKEEHKGYVVRQMSAYRSEYDYLEHDMETDVTGFENFIISHRPGQEIQLLHRLLNNSDFRLFNCLQDKTFKVTVLKELDEQTSSFYKVEFE